MDLEKIIALAKGHWHVSYLEQRRCHPLSSHFSNICRVPTVTLYTGMWYSPRPSFLTPSVLVHPRALSDSSPAISLMLNTEYHCFQCLMGPWKRIGPMINPTRSVLPTQEHYCSLDIPDWQPICYGCQNLPLCFLRKLVGLAVFIRECGTRRRGFGGVEGRKGRKGKGRKG